MNSVHRTSYETAMNSVHRTGYETAINHRTQDRLSDCHDKQRTQDRLSDCHEPPYTGQAMRLPWTTVHRTGYQTVGDDKWWSGALAEVVTVALISVICYCQHIDVVQWSGGNNCSSVPECRGTQRLISMYMCINGHEYNVERFYISIALRLFLFAVLTHYLPVSSYDDRGSKFKCYIKKKKSMKKFPMSVATMRR